MLPIGEELSGRYRIERVLGKGGMGAVYLGVMESLGGKKFAIKEMEFSGDADRTSEQALAQFRKEAGRSRDQHFPQRHRNFRFFADRAVRYGRDNRSTLRHLFFRGYRLLPYDGKSAHRCCATSSVERGLVHGDRASSWPILVATLFCLAAIGSFG